jgi:hypothetical protein
VPPALYSSGPGEATSAAQDARRHMCGRSKHDRLSGNAPDVADGVHPTRQNRAGSKIQSPLTAPTSVGAKDR